MIKVGNIYSDSKGNSVKILTEVKTCCSPIFYHGEVLEGIDSGNVFAYDSEGRRLNHLLSQTGNKNEYLKEDF